MTMLLVARHGEADWNAERRWLGHADRPLTARGRRQAHELAQRLDGLAIDAAYASDLSRALDTARALLAGRTIGVVSLRELRERDYGAWDGLHDDEIPRRFPEEYGSWKDGDGHGAADAEPFGALATRVEQTLSAIGRAHPDATVLLVAHAGPMRVLHALAHGLDCVRDRRAIPEPPHATLVRYVLDGRGLRPGLATSE